MVHRVAPFIVAVIPWPPSPQESAISMVYVPDIGSPGAWYHPPRFSTGSSMCAMPISSPSPSQNAKLSNPNVSSGSSVLIIPTKCPSPSPGTSVAQENHQPSRPMLSMSPSGASEELNSSVVVPLSSTQYDRYQSSGSQSVLVIAKSRDIDATPSALSETHLNTPSVSETT